MKTISTMTTASTRGTCSTDLASAGGADVACGPATGGEHGPDRGGDRGGCSQVAKNGLGIHVGATSSAGKRGSANRGVLAPDDAAIAGCVLQHPVEAWRDRGCQTVAAFPVGRFGSKVDFNGPIPPHAPDLGPCWVWTASRDDDGYGRFSFRGHAMPAHRLALMFVSGRFDAPPSEQACHRCDNPSCVRGTHLFWGTNSANQVDAYSKARNGLQKRAHAGASNGNAKLTSERVAEVRARRGAGEKRQAIADDLGISYHTVRLIELGRLWKTSAPLPQMAAPRRAGGAS